MERNTQFAGFAKALWDELPDLNVNSLIAFDEWSATCEKIIAQRAYDLVGHALDHAFTRNIVFGTREDATNQIPDMPTLPEVSQ